MLGPVFYQEMLLGGRRNQLHVFRWIYAGWLVFQIGGLYFIYLMYETAHQFDPTGYTASSAPEIVGSWFTRLFLIQQMILLLLATPALVAGAVADEKRRGTLQYLLLASLDTRHILLGKLFGRSAQVALLMIAGLPLYALFAGFSGINPLTMLLTGVALLMPIFALSAGTLLASVFCRQTRDAVLALYCVGLFGWLLVWIVGGPLAYLDPLYVLEPAWGPLRSFNWPVLAERFIVSLIEWAPSARSVWASPSGSCGQSTSANWRAGRTDCGNGSTASACRSTTSRSTGASATSRAWRRFTVSSACRSGSAWRRSSC